MKNTRLTLAVVFITVISMCLCACGTGAALIPAAEAAGVEKSGTPAESAEAKTAVKPGKTVEELLSEADALIEQEKYEEALDILTGSEQYKQYLDEKELEKKVDEIRARSKGSVDPDVDNEKTAREVVLTKDNFWDYFEYKILYIIDPFGKPDTYSKELVLKEEYADKIAYDKAFHFAVEWISHSSCSNYYKIDPETYEMTFLRTDNFYSQESRRCSTYSNKNFTSARLWDYSLFGGSPVETWTYVDTRMPYVLDYAQSGLYLSRSNGENVYYVSVDCDEVNDVTGNIFIYG